MLVRLETLYDWKFCSGGAPGRVLPANAFEHIRGKIVADLIEAAAVPVAEFTPLVEKRYSAPLAALIGPALSIVSDGIIKNAL